jgi:hypothetical protein
MGVRVPQRLVADGTQCEAGGQVNSHDFIMRLGQEKPKLVNPVTVKLVGGPMNGRTVEIEEGAEEYRVLWWKYQWTNSKDGKTVLFALASRSRPAQRNVKWFIETFGQHPQMAPKVQPYVIGRAERGRNEPCKCGSGKKNKRCCDVA